MKNILNFFIILLFIIGCENSVESDIIPESANINGTINFLNINNWPESGYVTISLSQSWPPSGPPSNYTSITSANLNSENQYVYEFENVVFGSYKAIAVAWENPDSTYNSSCNKSILGAFGGSAIDYFMNPDSLVTSVENNIFDNIDFDADFNYAIPNPYSICQPPCVSMPTQSDCESQGHCMWMDMGDGMMSCMTKI